MNEKLAKLLKDFGYRVDGNRIISLAIRGFCGESTLASCRNLFDAAEYLRPIICDGEYSSRLDRICVNG